MTQAFSPIPPVLLMEQMGALAEHPVNLGQDAAKSVLLHLGKEEAEVCLDCALIQIWHRQAV